MANDAEKWADPRDQCIHCGLSDFGVEFGPRTFIACPCCRDRGTHKACEEAIRGQELSEEIIDNLHWFCSLVSLHQARTCALRQCC